jgi:hypothetical protein
MSTNKVIDKLIGIKVNPKDRNVLAMNDFHYDQDEECFKGYIEDEEGDLHLYNYWPHQAFFEEVFLEPDDFTGAGGYNDER